MQVPLVVWMRPNRSGAGGAGRGGRGVWAGGEDGKRGRESRSDQRMASEWMEQRGRRSIADGAGGEARQSDRATERERGRDGAVRCAVRCATRLSEEREKGRLNNGGQATVALLLPCRQVDSWQERSAACSFSFSSSLALTKGQPRPFSRVAPRTGLSRRKTGAPLTHSTQHWRAEFQTGLPVEKTGPLLLPARGACALGTGKTLHAAV